MKKSEHIIITLAAFLLTSSAFCLHAQEPVAVTIPEGYELADSLVYNPVSAIDTSLAGKDILLVMPDSQYGASVKVRQNEWIEEALRAHVQANASRPMPGYRVRIFFDNRQSARAESEATLKRFTDTYHGIGAYRTYANPYFKVTVGDFRTKSEAMELLGRIKHKFPGSFVVKENIEYPIVDKDNTYIVDTVQVLRPKVMAL